MSDGPEYQTWPRSPALPPMPTSLSNVRWANEVVVDVPEAVEEPPVKTQDQDFQQTRHPSLYSITSFDDEDQVSELSAEPLSDSLEYFEVASESRAVTLEDISRLSLHEDVMNGGFKDVVDKYGLSTSSSNMV